MKVRIIPNKINSSNWIKTYTGKKFHLFNPSESEICIEDMAHSLSLLCRFCGHVPFLYSVASHSIIGSYLCKKKDALTFLLHDSTECFIGDMASPLKSEMSAFKKTENDIFKIISKKFCLPHPMDSEIKAIDKLMFRMEWFYLMKGEKIIVDEVFPLTKTEFIKIAKLSWKKVEKKFLERFYELSKDNKTSKKEKVLSY